MSEIEFNKSNKDKHIYSYKNEQLLYEFLKMLPKYTIHLNNWLNLMKSFLNFVKLLPRSATDSNTYEATRR